MCKLSCIDNVVQRRTVSSSDHVGQWERLDELKKPQLMVLAQCLQSDVKHAMRKAIIKNLLIDRLEEDEIFEEDCLEKKSMLMMVRRIGL